MLFKQKLKIFYITSVFSLVFAVLGFSYNAWRMELSEENNTIRTAAFEVFIQLSELEQIIYAAHYDKDIEQGSPRKAWVKVGLVSDLSVLISEDVQNSAASLHRLWSENWRAVAEDEEVTQSLVTEIEKVRSSVQVLLSELE